MLLDHDLCYRAIESRDARFDGWFVTAVRTTGMSVVYGLGISVFGGFAQFFVTWLLHVTGNPMAPAWYLMVTVTLSTVVLFWIQDRTGHDIDSQEP